ncbi:cytochrome C oxidase subunit IV family protein [Paraconexibacter sp.]|uniref:cytochrome C oxidase subunit IV family protein n=1 Tax=Paraconexibacter sp. TaxID=2949640 RepID=UPI003567B62B
MTDDLDLLRSRQSLVWAVLVLATIASLYLGTDHGLDDRDAGAAVLLGVAFVKVHLVGRHFMELHSAARWLRRVFDLYVGVVGLGLIGLVLVL